MFGYFAFSQAPFASLGGTYYALNISEDITVADQNIGLGKFAYSITEPTNLADIVAAVSAKFIVYVNENFNSADSIAVNSNYLNSITENLVANDSNIVLKTYNTQITEPVSVTDSTSCFGFGTIDNTQNTVWVQVDNRQ